MTTRRDFLARAGTAAGALALGGCAPALAQSAPGRDPDLTGRARTEALLAAARQPVLRQALLPGEPLGIESVDLMRAPSRGRETDWLVRVRAAGGAEGLAVVHGGVMEEAYPIFRARVAPVAVGTDARAWEDTLGAIYEGRGGFGSNYKWQGLPFWTSVAGLELAVLDLLGRAAGRNVVDLLWDGPVRREIDVYQASSARGNSAEDEVAWAERVTAQYGARALKIRLGARMRTTPFSDARDAALIPALRRAFPEHTLYADANSSYDVAQSLRAGRMLEDAGYAFFEEPVPFDAYDETAEVARGLTIPVAGGEQEASTRQFLWMLDHRAVAVAQPDLFYHGGLIRSLRVARAAHAVGADCTPHISGIGLGYLYAVQFAAVCPNAGPYHEFKGSEPDLPAEAVGGSLRPVAGRITIPDGPGLGVTVDPAWVAASTVVSSSTA